jgi:CHAD domain-containing protein
MGFSLEHRADVRDDIVRVMSEQVDKAVTALVDAPDDPAEAVHECRTRCKKIRGAVRLVRPALGDGAYRQVNDLARDAARSLAASRDATAMSQTFERLRKQLDDELDHQRRARERWDRLAEALATRRSATEAREDDLRADVQAALDLLSELDRAIADIELDAEGWSALGGGLATTYGRGRSAMRDAVDGPTGPRFHEWRKRAKYTRYHLDLLAPAAPTVLEPLERAFHDLTDALGDGHDLVVLGTWLRSDEAADLIDDDPTKVRVVVDGARAELEHRAIGLGRRLYAESPKRLAARLGAYWDAWTEEDGHQPAGGIEDALG